VTLSMKSKGGREHPGDTLPIVTRLPRRVPTAGDLRKAREEFCAAKGITLKRAAETGGGSFDPPTP
jgi:hypothetical protein